MPQQPPEAALGRTKVVAINGGLHALLKAKAAREGRPLQVLVEEQLAPLFTSAELLEFGVSVSTGEAVPA